MKKILFALIVCFSFSAGAQSPFNVSGAATFKSAYSSDQYHYKRTALDTIYADGHELLVIDDSTTTTTCTIHLPTSSILPYPGQFFSIYSMDTIGTVTVTASPYTIQGTSVTTLGPAKKINFVWVWSARYSAYVWLRTQ